MIADDTAAIDAWSNHRTDASSAGRIGAFRPMASPVDWTGTAGWPRSAMTNVALLMSTSYAAPVTDL
jgi:hypothetical protein